MESKARTTARGHSKRYVVERLLAWGIAPSAIAQQLHCSVAWVYTIRRDTGRKPAG